LIVLEIRKRTFQGEPCWASLKQETRLGRRASILFLFEKTSFASNTSGIFAVRLRSRLVCSRFQNRRWAWDCSQTGRRFRARPDMLPLHNVRFLKGTGEPNSKTRISHPASSRLSPPLIEDHRPAEP
jgi:hypothetical protein